LISGDISYIQPLNIKGYMKTSELELFEIAESQQGYFSFQQAIAAGLKVREYAGREACGSGLCDSENLCFCKRLDNLIILRMSHLLNTGT
jgi:hypothetical protein